jgi:DNA-directed RNA polymerase specialized sigma subunit
MKSKLIERLNGLDLSCLSDRELMVLEARGFFERVPQKILAAELGITTQGVDHVEKTARKKLFSQPQNSKARTP